TRALGTELPILQVMEARGRRVLGKLIFDLHRKVFCLLGHPVGCAAAGLAPGKFFDSRIRIRQALHHEAGFGVGRLVLWTQHLPSFLAAFRLFRRTALPVFDRFDLASSTWSK